MLCKQERVIQMTRSEKIKKLANAIRVYRGATSSQPGAIKVVWAYTPQPHKLKRIRELLGLLQYDLEEQDYFIKQIDGFQRLADFDAWIKTLK